MSSLVIRELNGYIGTIILDDKKRYNALSEDLISEIISAFNFFKEKRVRLVIIRAKAGANVWSAGHNIKELPNGSDDPLSYNIPMREVIRTVQNMPYPVIAMIEGSVWGGACELVMSCDVIVSDKESTFAITPSKLGIPYDAIGLQNFMRSINLPIIKEMLFTGKPITAERAVILGMINYAVKNDELEAFTQNIAETIVNNAPLAIAIAKEELNYLAGSTYMTPDEFEKIQSGRRIVYNSEDYKEGIASFFEKRKPVFKGK